MIELRHLRAADARRVPWRNGRGVTEELALWPPGADFAGGAFDWRISRAAVDEPGAFSMFPGFDRVLVITSGAGLVLEHGGAAPPARVSPLEPYRFAGEWVTTAALPGGRVADFNVLTRRGACTAEVGVLRGGRRGAGHVRNRAAGESGAREAAHLLLHVLSGSFEARVPATDGERPGAAPIRALLAEGESLWCCGAAAPQLLGISGSGPDATALFVQLRPVAPR